LTCTGFWTREGWEQVPSTHHPTFELATASGVVLRSRCSNPIDGTTIDDPKQWRKWGWTLILHADGTYTAVSPDRNRTLRTP